MPIFTLLGLIGNVLSILVLRSPGIDMKVSSHLPIGLRFRPLCPDYFEILDENTQNALIIDVKGKYQEKSCVLSVYFVNVHRRMICATSVHGIS